MKLIVICFSPKKFKKKFKNRIDSNKGEEIIKKINADTVELNLLDQADVMPDRGPTEFGNMLAYSSLDRGF